MLYRHFVLLVVLLATASLPCFGREMPRFSSVRLTRESCEGGCPSYSIEIHRDGVVIFDGPKGKQLGQLSPADMRLLSSALGWIKSASLPSNFYDQITACSDDVRDLQRSFVDVANGSTSYRLPYNAACKGITGESKVGWLADTIDEVAGTEKWLSIP